jgi:hypothetical protein
MRANACTGPCEINPANYYEFFLQGFMMLIGSSLWAYIIGSGCGIVLARPTPSLRQRMCQSERQMLYLLSNLNRPFCNTLKYSFQTAQNL